MLKRYDRPMLLLFEDLQWAGSVNLSLLQRMAEDITDHPIMIVANYRSEETPYLKDLFPYAHHIQLERFAKDELVALARSVLGDMAIGLRPRWWTCCIARPRATPFSPLKRFGLSPSRPAAWTTSDACPYLGTCSAAASTTSFGSS